VRSEYSPPGDIHERWEDPPADRKIIPVDRDGKQVCNSTRRLACKGFTLLAMLERSFVESWKEPSYPVEEGQ